jgi:hypothetical protein
VEVAAVHAMLVLDLPDDGLDGRAAAHLAFDLRGDAALLLGRVGNCESVYPQVSLYWSKSCAKRF